MNSRLLIGGIVGGVAFFLLGFLIYGILLADFMAVHYNDCMQRTEDQFAWWAMIASNFVFGLFLALLMEWNKSDNLTDGLKTGLIIGFLTALAWDLSFWSMSTMFYSREGAVVDVLVSTAYVGAVGAIIGFVRGKVNARGR